MCGSSVDYLSIPLQVLCLCLGVLHVQHVLVARIVIRAQQLRQRVVKLCWVRRRHRYRSCIFRSLASLIKPCHYENICMVLMLAAWASTPNTHLTYANSHHLTVTVLNQSQFIPCKLSSVALFRSSSSLISWASYMG